jgi:hypothetical protein
VRGEIGLPINNTLEVPTWIDSGAYLTGGLDLLGLRLPVQNIGGTLLNGVTTVTPKVRYIAFRAWLIHRYGQSGLPDSWRTFTEFALRFESAVVIGNLIQNREIGGLIGADQALIRLDANTPSIAIAPLVKSPAATIYAGPSDQLGVTRSRDDAVPALVIERGQPLASIVDRRFSLVPVIRRLIEDQALSEVSQDDLRELGAVARIDQIPDDERDALVAGIVPTAPRHNEIARVGTYTALLTLASAKRALPSEHDLFEAACSKSRFGEPLLDDIADGWTTYCVRDLIAVTQEAVLSAVMTEITTSPNQGLSGVDRTSVIASLMERVDEHATALRGLELLGPSESMTDLSFGQLCSRVEARIAFGLVKQKGISRWDAVLMESTVYGLAQKVGAGALSLAAVAWILAEVRVGSAIRENGNGMGNLSYKGRQRMGLREVILPELERFHREDRSLRDVAAELAHRTVHQHFKVAWSRLQADPTRDVGLLTTDGDLWFARPDKGFGGGRTASRVQQALGWLEQLRLIDASGITTEGEIVRQSGLQALAATGAP